MIAPYLPSHQQHRMLARTFRENGQRFIYINASNNQRGQDIAARIVGKKNLTLDRADITGTVYRIG